MYVHVLRVQKTKSQKQWWIKGHTEKGDDLMIFKPYVDLTQAIRQYNKKHNCEIHRIQSYKGCFQPAEAAMTCVDIARQAKEVNDES